MSTPTAAPTTDRTGRFRIALVAVGVVGTLTIVGLSLKPGQPAPRTVRPPVVPTAAAPSLAPAIRQRFVENGIAVDLSIDRVNAATDHVPGTVREGDDVIVQFTLTDATSRLPVKSVYPAAWLADRLPGADSGAKYCASRALSFMGGSLLNAPELDLNAYQIVTLNQDPTLSVLDPIQGFGGSRLLAVVELAARGEDWAIGEEGTRLYVAQPEAGRVAAVDTIAWKVVDQLDVDPRPARLKLQSNGCYLWVAHDRPESSDPTVTVVDAIRGKVVARVAVGAGPHDFAFSASDRYAFVTNGGGGTVSVVDTSSLKVVSTVPAGPRPRSPSYAILADAVYVADTVDDAVIAIDARRLEVRARIPAGRGPNLLAAAPGGRHVMVVGPARDELVVLDTATNRVIHRVGLHSEPDQIVYSQEFAYIRHRGTEQLVLIPLAELGRPRKDLPKFEFQAGQNPIGRHGQSGPAAAIARAPGMNAVLVANSADKAIYFYKEGMASPMGNFRTYGKVPEAVLAVDRSLREAERPGVYRTLTRLRRPGSFDLIFFLDAPRLVHCFPVEVQADPELARKRDAGRSVLEPLDVPTTAILGRPVALKFRLLDRATRTPRVGLVDVNVLVALASGTWQVREWAREAGPGVYALEVQVPRPGYYWVWVKSDSGGLPRDNSNRLIIRVEEPPAPIIQMPESDQAQLASPKPSGPPR
jgi:YVTN family beta-propeller protein